MSQYKLDYLEQMESEALHIFREVAGQFERPALLFSGGKDSITLVHLALKAFRPGKFPFPLVHIDTGHNFQEALDFRDQLAARIGEKLVVRKVEDTIKVRHLTEPTGKFASRNALQTYTLLDTIEEFGFDACIGGARRDEEKARAKERVFSFRDAWGQWDPKNQRPELWNLYNARVAQGEHMRVFPISHWTELDVWQYIARERLAVPNIYFAHTRPVVRRPGGLLPVTELTPARAGERVEDLSVRFRTVGDISCTYPVESNAVDYDAIVAETVSATLTERGATRMDDQTSEASMEQRKKEGYF